MRWERGLAVPDAFVHLILGQPLNVLEPRPPYRTAPHPTIREISISELNLIEFSVHHPCVMQIRTGEVGPRKLPSYEIPIG